MSADQWRRWDKWAKKRTEERAAQVAENYWQMVEKAWKGPDAPEDIRFQRELIHVERCVGKTPTSK